MPEQQTVQRDGQTLYVGPPTPANPEGLYEYPMDPLFVQEETLSEWLINQAIQICQMLLAKRQRYGTSQIDLYGLDGVGVHLVDKAHRFYNQRETLGDDELADHLADTVGYALIGLSLLERGEW